MEAVLAALGRGDSTLGLREGEAGLLPMNEGSVQRELPKVTLQLLPKITLQLRQG